MANKKPNQLHRLQFHLKTQNSVVLIYQTMKRTRIVLTNCVVRPGTVLSLKTAPYALETTSYEQ